jgi:two-component system nitrate/nitrite response regulator NarL
MAEQVTISLLGGNPILLDGLSRLLSENDFKIVGLGNNVMSLELPDDLVNPHCHLILVDGLIETLGAAFLDDVHQKMPNGLMIVLTDQFNYDLMMECFRHDASAYIVKKISTDSLISYLNLVSVGEKIMPSDLTDSLLSRMPTSPPQTHRIALADTGLTAREEEILAGLVAGQPNKVISRRFLISEATVKVHVKAILRKIGVQNRTQAAIWAMGDRDDAACTHAEPCSSSRSGNSRAIEQL